LQLAGFGIDTPTTLSVGFYCGAKRKLQHVQLNHITHHQNSGASWA